MMQIQATMKRGRFGSFNYLFKLNKEYVNQLIKCVDYLNSIMDEDDARKHGKFFLDISCIPDDPTKDDITEAIEEDF